MTHIQFFHFLRRPTLTRGVLFLLKRNLYEFQKNWHSLLIWGCVEPMIYLLAFGFGLGHFIQQVRGEPYLSYFLPGLLCLSVGHSAYLESSINGFSRFHQVHLYRYLLLSPVTPDDLAAGDILWTSVRAMISTAPLFVFGWAYGILKIQFVLPSLLALFLVAGIFSATGLAVAAGVRKNQAFTRGFSMVVIPMSFFSGAFFPIDVLPQTRYWIIWPLPMHQAVLFIKESLNGNMTVNAGIHGLILFLLGIIAIMVAMSLTGKRLLKE
jgi:lipooligosaccharide transport system permease protein